MARVLLCTFGSLGDLHPYLAIGLELKRRGHRATIGTSEVYRERVTALGLGFRPVRPHHQPTDPAVVARLMDARRGTQRVMRELVFPYLRETLDDLVEALADEDLFVSGSLLYVAPLVAHASGAPWVSSVLAPVSLFSATDPPVYPNAPGLAWLRRLGPAPNRLVRRIGRTALRPVSAPFERLRRELGAPPVGHPIFEGQHAPRRALALFSPRFAPPQPDWPPQATTTGFAVHEEATELPAPLARFLDDGPPPLVFALGSAAVHAAGDFQRQSLAAAGRLGRRAVLLAAPGADLPDPLPEGVVAVPYAPYGALFPRAAALIHHGGIGTTAQALRAGVPALVAPFAHDQFDNAARVARLGVGLALPRSRYRAEAVAPRVARLLDDAAMRERAASLGAALRAERGERVAADLIEAELAT